MTEDIGRLLVFLWPGGVDGTLAGRLELADVLCDINWSSPRLFCGEPMDIKLKS